MNHCSMHTFMMLSCMQNILCSNTTVLYLSALSHVAEAYNYSTVIIIALLKYSSMLWLHAGKPGKDMQIPLHLDFRQGEGI